MLLDIVVIALLCITVAFCWRLNNKMIELKDSRKDLKDLVKALDSAIIQTHKSLTALKDASSNSAVQLDSYARLSKELINDLSFMTASASKIADRLESAISSAKLTEKEVPEKADSIPMNKISKIKASRIPKEIISKDTKVLKNRIAQRRANEQYDVIE